VRIPFSRHPKRLILLGAVGFLILLVVAVLAIVYSRSPRSQGERGRGAATISGLWVAAPFGPRTHLMAALSDGSAWIEDYSKRHLTLVSVKGEILASWPLPPLKDREGIYAFGTGKGDGLWLMTSSHYRWYYVDRNTSPQQLDFGKSLLQPSGMYPVDPGATSSAWMITEDTRNSHLFFVEKSTVTEVKTNALIDIFNDSYIGSMAISDISDSNKIVLHGLRRVKQGGDLSDFRDVWLRINRDGQFMEIEQPKDNDDKAYMVSKGQYVTSHGWYGTKKLSGLWHIDDSLRLQTFRLPVPPPPAKTESYMLDKASRFLCVTRSGGVWVLVSLDMLFGRNNSLFHFDPSLGNVTSYQGGIWSDEDIMPARDQQDAVWVETIDKDRHVSVSLLKFADKSFVTLANIPAPFVIYRMNYAFEPSQIWLRTSLGLLLCNSSGEIVNSKSPLFPGERTVSSPVCASESVCWLDPLSSSGEGVFTLGQAKRNVTGWSATLRFGGSALRLNDDAVGTIHYDPGGEKRLVGTLDLDWPGRKGALALGERNQGNVTVSISESGKGGKELVRSTRPLGEEGQVELAWLPPFGSGAAYAITVRYTSPLGSDFQIVWPYVVFDLPWYAAPWVRALLGATLIFGCSILLLFWKPFAGTVARWLPGAIVFASGGGGLLFPATLKALTVEPTLFAAFLFAESALFIAVGLFQPVVFWAIARSAPIDSVIPLAMQLRHLRRLHLRHHIARTRSRIRTLRAGAYGEQYISLPATVETPSANERLEIDPVAYLLALIREGAHMSDGEAGERLAAHVLLLAGGGVGKSALLREVVWQALEAFEKDPSLPIPVYCEFLEPADGDAGQGAKTLEEAAEAALVPYLASNTALRAQLLAGHYCLFLDDLQNALSLKPEALLKFVRGDGRYTPLIVASRPTERFESAIAQSEPWIVVEPQRLEDRNEKEDTLSRFVRAYSPSSGGELPEAVKAFSHNAQDNTYLPILVRMTLVALEKIPAEKLHGGGVAAIYDNAFTRLLEKSGAAQDASKLLAEAAKLCVEAYWQSGNRSFACATATSERSKLLMELTRAGLMVPSEVGREQLPGTLPHEVRFFHDSMQSYLCARGLFGEDKWDVFARAAGNPLFVERPRTDDPFGGSELFRMMLSVYAPLERVRDILAELLSNWAETYGDTMSRDTVLKVLPGSIIDAVTEKVDPKFGGAEHLRIAVEYSMNTTPEAKAVDLLGFIFARLAPKYYSLDRVKEGTV
jgi:hypothetical protein